MGTTVRVATSAGKTYHEAFERLQNEDAYEYGHDSYNGGFNNVTILLAEVKELPEDIGKRYAVGRCIRKPVQNTNKVKSEVKAFPNKGERTWVTEYYTEPSPLCALRNEEKHIPTFIDTHQEKCIEKARQYVEKNPGIELEVHIRKVLKGKVTKVAEVKYKPSSDEKEGIWEFIGGCPE